MAGKKRTEYHSVTCWLLDAELAKRKSNQCLERYLIYFKPFGIIGRYFKPLKKINGNIIFQ